MKAIIALLVAFVAGATVGHLVTDKTCVIAVRQAAGELLDEGVIQPGPASAGNSLAATAPDDNPLCGRDGCAPRRWDPMRISLMDADGFYFETDSEFETYARPATQSHPRRITTYHRKSKCEMTWEGGILISQSKECR